ncbi:MAG TPA: hypothetical protein VM940_02170 [Chthoniobacterales bacterium]|jgi:hypothetical protein|nr:hypothetical protein [Chthoniobacterales bacterium]
MKKSVVIFLTTWLSAVVPAADGAEPNERALERFTEEQGKSALHRQVNAPRATIWCRLPG